MDMIKIEMHCVKSAKGKLYASLESESSAIDRFDASQLRINSALSCVSASLNEILRKEVKNQLFQNQPGIHSKVFR